MSDRGPDIRDWLVRLIAERLDVAPEAVAPDRPFEEFGLSSRDAVAISAELEDFLGRRLRPTLLWEHPTIDRLAGALTQDDEPVVPRPRVPEAAEAIAIVGMGCRFPGGVRGPGQFWEMLRDGVDGIVTVPPGRWEDFVESGRDGDVVSQLPRQGGFLDDVDGFDAEFFGISPREAALMDPQQRLLLEVSWEAMEHAGLVPAQLRGSPTGVFVGVSAAEYGHLTTRDLGAVDAWTGTGAATSIVANRLSYFLDLRGPSVAVDTACSSSLVAVHQACASLRTGESRTALAAGVNLLLSPAITANFHRADALAADGRCKAFDAGADGIVRGEGCGVVVLKRLRDAQRDQDRVLGVIRGSAVNSDGRSNGLMAPNPAAQKELLRTAYATADLDAAIVDYVETHGTGTLLGDPIEAEALGSVLGAERARGRSLLLGSVKTNIGHLEAAAGIAGLIKVVLAMRHGQLPPSLHYDTPNPHIPFEQAGLEVVDTARQWPKYSGIARAGISGFGFGGTNAHVVVEAWQNRTRRRGAEDAGRARTFVVHAASEQRMRRRAAELADWLETPDGAAANLDDLSYTLTRRRAPLPERGAVVARGREELTRALRAVGDRGDAPRGRAAARDSGMVWVFSGYGSQWPGMCSKLLDDEPAFATAVSTLDVEFAEQCGFSLDEVLREGRRLDDVRSTQLVLFGVQVALARLWRAHGAEPAAVLGHSLGEVAAAVVAGALSVPDGLRVMRVRASLLSEVDEAGAGSMAVVELPPDEVPGLAEWFPGVTVAVRTSPRRCTVAGPVDEVARLAEYAERHGRMAKVLNVSGAGHTAAVDGIVDRLRAELADLAPADPTIPVYSTSQTDPREAPVFDARYWARNVRNPVAFDVAVRAASQDGFSTFVELAPHPVAAIGIEESAAEAEDVVVAHSCRRDTDDAVTFHSNLAALYVHGRVSSIGPDTGKLVDLPPPHWEHQRHWVTAKRSQAPIGEHPLLGVHVELPGGGHAWRGDVGTGGAQWLADHRVHDTPVLPGAAYLEMVLSAAAQALHVRTADLRVERLQLHQFLLVDESTPVTTTLTATGPRSAGVEVHTRSATGRWTRHASAEITPMTGTPAAAAESAEHGEPIRLYETLPDGYYGPAFQGIESVHAAGGVAVGEVVLPEQAGESSRFALHPALLDSCLQVLLAAATGPGAPPGAGLSVPVELADVRPLQALPRRVRCHARLTEDHGSLLVTDTSGTPLLEIGAVRAQRLDATEVARPVTEAMLETRWEAEALAPDPAAPGSWVVTGGDGELTEALRTAGHQVHEALDDCEDPARLHGVVVVVPECATIPAEQQAILSLAAVVRELARRSVRPRLFVVAEEHRASLRSLIRVLTFEHPELRASLVCGASVPNLVAELVADRADDEIRWHGDDRSVARLSQVRLDPVRTEHVVRPAAYVVTGGLGGLGRTVARWLAERGARRVVLNSRGEPSAEIREQIERLPAQVVVISGDVAERDVARALVREATRDGVALAGVVHAAGVLEDGPVVDLGESALERVWRPKVWGAWSLHEATADLELDWWVVFSSQAALVGSPGQAAYATANARVDELVRQRRDQGLPATTIQWGLWGSVGGAGEGLSDVVDPLDPAEGVEALEAVLASGREATGIARVDFRRAAEFFPGLETRPFFGAVLQARERTAVVDLSGDDPVAAITAHLVSEVAGILSCSPRQLDPRTPLTDLGLDSLMAMRARNAVERDFGVSVPAPVLLRGGSLGDVADHLATSLGLDSGERSGRASGVGPRDATERWVAHLWKEALGLDSVDVTDDFFALGGDEILAEKIAAQVRERLDSAVTSAELFAEPSIERFADLARDGYESDVDQVRVLREGGTGTPVFLFHPAGGPTSVYQPLVDRIAGDQPCYGMERLDDDAPVEDKAVRYLDLIREIQPTGPYRLGGWSFGGCLAYETAQQLTLAGEAVEVVALIDTILPLPAPEKTQQQLIIDRYQRFIEHIERTYGHTLDIRLDEIAELGEDEQMNRVMSALSEADLGIGAGVLRHQYTSYVDARIAERYQPKPYHGRVVLYRAQYAEDTTTTLDPRYLRTDEALGWDAVSSDLEVVRVPGNHLSMIDPPHVDVIASHLATALETPTR